MKRNVIEINEEKCVGCGLCAGACMQGAIEIINGKAKLVSDSYCDGLGMCLPKCPVDAIHLVEKEASEFNQERKNIKASPSKDMPETLGCGCPGSEAKTFERTTIALNVTAPKTSKVEPSLETTKKTPVGISESSEEAIQIGEMPSELMQWPVQLMLVPPTAPYLENADILIAADCTAFAHGDFHRTFMRNKVTIIACPKLDDNVKNIERLTQIFSSASVKSITVVRMEVPCCGGLTYAVKEAMLNARRIVPYNEITLSTDGRIL